MSLIKQARVFFHVKIINNKIKEIIVVEGKSDINFLSSFLDADFYQVNGSSVCDEDIEFLKKVSSTRGVIVLTDPDYPGLQIRNYILKRIPDSKQAYIRKEVSIKHHKVGVAESTKEEVTHALENVATYSGKLINNYTYYDLYSFGLTGAQDSRFKRKYLCEKLNIGYSNAKELLLKLNSLDINLSEIEEILKNAN